LRELDPERVHDYFARRQTVTSWWTPGEGPLAFHYDAELQVLDEQLALPAHARVLDVGTGRGRFGAHFAEGGHQVLGVDLNAAMEELARAAARRRGLADRFEVRRAGAEDLSGLDLAGFDLVLCMELFDHLPDLSRALAEMVGALRPGGQLAFTYVPDESLYGALGNAYRWWSRRREGTRGELMISRTYSLSEVRRLLAGAGLSLEGHWGIGVLCLNAQTRLFTGNPLLRLATAVARWEARWRPYHAGVLARHGAHVVGVARRSVP
jgi:2-polyprenyl-6-hydroxyphenyl methylase/3-demethylubiquinone-9 3-methyltransferase